MRNNVTRQQVKQAAPAQWKSLLAPFMKKFGPQATQFAHQLQGKGVPMAQWEAQFAQRFGGGAGQAGRAIVPRQPNLPAVIHAQPSMVPTVHPQPQAAPGGWNIGGWIKNNPYKAMGAAAIGGYALNGAMSPDQQPQAPMYSTYGGPIDAQEQYYRAYSGM